jgi:branched-chain amino acid transport system permease protein
VLQGQLYALLALGFVVIYRASKVFNLAQGELMLLGAYMVWTLALGLQLPPWARCRWPSSPRWPAAG